MNALLRAVPDSYTHAVRRDPTVPDVALARAQHAAYARALERLGYAVRVLPADEDCPDGPFVEDTAVVARGRALVTRSAHPARAREHDAVAVALAEAGLEVVRLSGGTLDGGDVLQVGDVLFVGRSHRTDEAGVAGLRATFAPLGLDVRPIDVPPEVLHLKCVCSTPAEGVALLAEGCGVDLDGVRVVRVPAEEAYAANTVGANGRVIVAAGHPATARALSALGLETIPLDLSEIRRADGALTCLSLRWSWVPRTPAGRGA